MKLGRNWEGIGKELGLGTMRLGTMRLWDGTKT